MRLEQTDLARAKRRVIRSYFAIGLSLFAFALAVFALMLAFQKPAQCQGKWCPPIDCYGGDCAECLCIQDNYPEPGYCASLTG